MWAGNKEGSKDCGQEMMKGVRMWAGNDERSKACGQEMMKGVKHVGRK